MTKIIIAIDGFSSCGKSTMAKDLAREIGYIYVDTGAMYRAVTLYALRNGMFNEEDSEKGSSSSIKADELEKAMPDIHITFKLNPSTGRPDTYLNGDNALPFVRKAMVAQQQAMGREKGIVMDGRDIGTTVFPNAELKIFVTASAEVRAQRRYDELKGKGQEANFDDILKNVQERDYIDTHREVSPLRKAADAIELDNSNMTIPEQNAWLLEQFHKATSAK